MMQTCGKGLTRKEYQSSWFLVARHTIVTSVIGGENERDWIGNADETEAVHRIRALQEQDLWRPSNFVLEVDLTVVMLLELYLTFVFNFELRGIEWKILEIDFHHSLDLNPLLLVDVMRVANRASLFDEIIVHGADELPETLQIVPSLEKNHRLKHLELCGNCRMCRIRFLLEQVRKVSSSPLGTGLGEVQDQVL